MTADTIAPNSLALAPEAVAEILVGAYGLRAASMQPFQSELSTVYRVALAGDDGQPDGRCVAFKAIHHTDDEHALARWRIAAMDHLQDLGIPAGRTIPSLAGEATAVVASPAGPVIAHVGEWLTGVPLEAAPLTPELLRAVGETAARATLALAEWPEPPAPVTHPWELVRTIESLDASMGAAEDSRISALLTRARVLYLERVAPVLADLPRAVVHHDMHDSNLLIDADRSAVTGVLDFGDMVSGPRIADLGITAGYACRRAADPVAAYLEVAAGWGNAWAEAVRAGESASLTCAEVDALYPASIGRLAVNLSIWTARSSSDRGEYARARSESTARALELLLDADLDAVQHALRAALLTA